MQVRDDLSDRLLYSDVTSHCAAATTTYYVDDVPTMHNPVSRYNVDEPKNDPKLSLFQYPGGKAGGAKRHMLTREENECIMLYVLMNMKEVLTFIR
jgi:hypothetical protein